jgi:hypothetical protein
MIVIVWEAKLSIIPCTPSPALPSPSHPANPAYRDISGPESKLKTVYFLAPAFTAAFVTLPALSDCETLVFISLKSGSGDLLLRRS